MSSGGATLMPFNYATPVLVVDDEPVMVRIITGLLRSAGFEDVDSTLTAQDALEMAAKKAYGIVISDLQMRPTSGLQLLRNMRGNSGFSNTRFIMTTASRSAADVVAAKHAGVDAYLLKPFTPAQLREKLREVL
jgi:DNA-binding response OmpR family regulator